MRNIAKILLSALIVVVACAAVFVFLEGVYAVAHFRKPDTSILYKAYAFATGERSRLENVGRLSGPPVLVDRAEIENIIPQLKQDGVGLGNSPFRKLVTEEASINYTENGCLRQKPNLRKELTQLRSTLFNQFDPINAFYDADRKLSPETRAFIDRYAVRKVHQTSNEAGERITLPAVDAPTIVLVAGDSVANGTGISDDETIASQLQARDATRKYVNIGIGSAQAPDIQCALRRAMQQYGSGVAELVYVYCENDFDPKHAMGTPEEVILWLKDFVGQNNIKKTTIVYSPYIYNTVPQYTRIPGTYGARHPGFFEQREKLFEVGARSGFRMIDLAEVLRPAEREAGGQFAILGQYVDHAHLSPAGVARLVATLLAPG